MNKDSLVDWLLGEGWQTPTNDALIAGIVGQIERGGAEVMRAFLGVPALHPLHFAQAVIWRRGGEVTPLLGLHRLRDAPDHVKSPLRPLIRGELTELRYRLDGPLPDMPVLHQFREEGGLDWFGVALPAAEGLDRALLTLLTADPGGFTPAQLDRVRQAVPMMARVVEGRSLRATAVNLLDTYVGRHAGERILRGQIQRGSVERISAAIAFCDLRGFTERSERLEPDALVATINQFFDVIVPPMRSRGAEVLKFMGDGMLAIVPISGDPDAACRGLLAGAREAQEALAAELGPDGQPMRCGIALHVGEVAYGNIGSRDRLDFTVIGPAVNLTARLEGVGKQLNRPIVLSEAFAARCDEPLALMGRFPLKGLAGEHAVFAPAT